MRLIDADKLIAEWNDMGISMNPDVFEKDVDYLINNQPTAYDVDKVVAELEKSKKSIVGKYNHATPMKEMPSYKIVFNEGIDKAIEIVKNGGVEPAEPEPQKPEPAWKKAFLRTFLGERQ